MKLIALLATALLAACSAEKPSKPPDLSYSARYVCKDFITRSGYRATEWLESPVWTTVKHGDGTWSVGAKFLGFAPGGSQKSLYVTCVMSNSGDNWQLESLSRM